MPSFHNNALGFRDLTIDHLHPQTSTSSFCQTISTGKGYSSDPPAIKSARTMPWILGIFEHLRSLYANVHRSPVVHSSITSMDTFIFYQKYPFLSTISLKKSSLFSNGITSSKKKSFLMTDFQDGESVPNL